MGSARKYRRWIATRKREVESDEMRRFANLAGLALMVEAVVAVLVFGGFINR